MTRLSVIFGLPLLLMLPSAHSAGFSCGMARSSIEYTICLDARLSDLDGIVSRNYVKELTRVTNPKEAHARQKEWLSQRDKCTSLECLLEIYRKRTRELAEKSDQITSEFDWEIRFPKDWSILGVTSDGGNRLDSVAVTDATGQTRQFGVPGGSETAIRTDRKLPLTIMNEESIIWNGYRLTRQNFRGFGYCGFTAPVLEVAKEGDSAPRRLIAFTRSVHEEGQGECDVIKRPFAFDGLGSIWLFKNNMTFSQSRGSTLIHLSSSFDSNATALIDDIHLADLNDLTPMVKKICGVHALRGEPEIGEVRCLDRAIETLLSKSIKK